MSEDKLPKYWLRDTVINFLKKRPNQEFSTPAIARWIVDEHLENCMRKKGFEKFKTDKERITQIGGEIGVAYTNGLISSEEPKIKAEKVNSIRYFEYVEFESSELIKDKQKISEKEVNKEVNKDESKESEKKLERELYEPLCEFLHLEFGVLCQYINESTSSNKEEKGSNRWLHPDIVGIEVSNWKKDVHSCAGRYINNRNNLWSFEIKLNVSKGTVREKFFQAVANSSWANFGYLVIGDIKASQKPSVMKELRMLSALHGIGCILVNKNSPSESDILIPAIRRQDVDWYSVNRLASENSDFLEYIASVDNLLETGKIRKKDWVNCKNLEE